MIHKKGGRIRTYGRPVPDLLGWVAGLAPLVASVPETDALPSLRLVAVWVLTSLREEILSLCLILSSQLSL